MNSSKPLRIRENLNYGIQELANIQGHTFQEQVHLLLAIAMRLHHLESNYPMPFYLLTGYEAAKAEHEYREAMRKTILLVKKANEIQALIEKHEADKEHEYFLTHQQKYTHDLDTEGFTVKRGELIDV